MNQLNGTQKARVTLRNRETCMIEIPGGGIEKAILTGKFKLDRPTSEYPVVGDHVMYDVSADGTHRIHVLCERTSRFSRKEAGKTINEQVLAANIDIVFIVTGLDTNFNLQRMLRYRTVVIEGGAKPVFLLSKADLCDDLDEKLEAIRRVMPDDDVITISTYTKTGLDDLRRYLKPDMTIALFGSSGVGKSSLTNALLGHEAMDTGNVSDANGKGKHTTTTAMLLKLPGGTSLIDSPGMRELQLWCSESSVEEGFADISLLAERCRFDDCTHGKEPGCAVVQAVRSGLIPEKHFKNYNKMLSEARYLESKKREKRRGR